MEKEYRDEKHADASVFGTDLAFVFLTTTKRIPELAERVEYIIASSGRK